MAFLSTLVNILLIVCSLFLICLVLIQRGKGGGLAGAFGGVGGSSAFGTKAGDVFTRVTIIVAGVWIALNMLLVMISNRGGESAWGDEDLPPAAVKEIAPTKTSTGTGTPTGGPTAKPGETSPARTPAPSGSPATLPAPAPLGPAPAPKTP